MSPTAGITVAVVGARDVAKEFGKKGTASDVTLFNHVEEDHALTLVEPTQYPDKFPPLLYAIEMADRVLFVVDALKREVAETATVLDLAERPLTISHGNAVGEEELRRAFKGMRLTNEPMRAYDPVHLREAMAGWTVPAGVGPTRVPLDHAFPVKGVGAVALGIVRGGPLEAHARLRLFPTDHEVEIRSIQVHDVDVRSATTGDRVGVALKGVEAEELSRGQVLAPPGALEVGSTLVGRDLRRALYYRGTLAVGGQFNLAVGLQLVPTRLESVGPEELRLVTDRPVAFRTGEPAFLADLSAPAGPRLAARVRLHL